MNDPSSSSLERTTRRGERKGQLELSISLFLVPHPFAPLLLPAPTSYDPWVSTTSSRRPSRHPDSPPFDLTSSCSFPYPFLHRLRRCWRGSRNEREEGYGLQLDLEIQTSNEREDDQLDLLPRREKLNNPPPSSPSPLPTLLSKLVFSHADIEDREGSYRRTKKPWLCSSCWCSQDRKRKRSRNAADSCTILRIASCESLLWIGVNGWMGRGHLGERRESWGGGAKDRDGR